MPAAVTTASPGTRASLCDRAMRFSGVPANRSRNGVDQATRKPQLAARSGVMAQPGRAVVQAPSDPSRGHDAPPQASTVASAARVSPSARRSAPPSAKPTQRRRIMNRTPNAASRASHARNSGDAFMAFGNTRKLLPTNVGCPSASHHATSRSGGNSAIARASVPPGG